MAAAAPDRPSTTRVRRRTRDAGPTNGVPGGPGTQDGAAAERPDPVPDPEPATQPVAEPGKRRIARNARREEHAAPEPALPAAAVKESAPAPHATPATPPPRGRADQGQARGDGQGGRGERQGGRGDRQGGRGDRQGRGDGSERQGRERQGGRSDRPSERPRSDGRPPGRGDRPPFVDPEEAEEAALRQLRVKLAGVLKRLPDIERRVLELRMGLADGMPNKPGQVASRLNLTIPEVKKIETRAFERIREVGPIRGLEKFLTRE